MGIYYIPCKSCQKVFPWFSGNLDQRCGDCTKIPYKDEAVARILEAQASPPDPNAPTDPDEFLKWLNTADTDSKS